MNQDSSQQRRLRIWQTVRRIPPGRVASYGQIADLAGLPGRARLVGKALGQCDEPLPWHRVLRADGRLAFPENSPTARRQRERLLAEGVPVHRNRVRLAAFRWQPTLAEMLFELEY